MALTNIGIHAHKWKFKNNVQCFQARVIASQRRKHTRAHHGDEIPERDMTYHLTCLLIYHGTTTHL